jgi:glycosyltransferase involved in cell wall biosynthesis
VQAYYLRAPHFSPHSGYELAVRDLAQTNGIVGVGQQWPRRPAEGAAARRPGDRLRQTAARAAQGAVSRLAGSAGYSTGALALELSAILRMARGRGQVFHFLYAEHSCRLTPAFDGWRGHRVLGTFHQTPQQLRAAIRRPGYLRRLGGAIMLGRSQGEFLGRYLPPERLHFIPHGVDTSYFRPQEVPPSRPAGTPLCAAIGGTLRDFQTLRGAIDLLRERSVPVQYDLIARGDQLPYVQGLPQARVREWVGEGEFRALYQRADLFVLPLHDAVASNTLLEALACGAPTVVTDAGAVRDYVDESCVAFARPGDPNSLADAMEGLLRDPQRAARLRAAGRARAEALDVRAVARRHQELYRSLLCLQGAPLGRPLSQEVGWR